MRSAYFEKLRDPRWQRRRLEIMGRADFACEVCLADDKTLHVHHVIYRKGAQPWDYADHELQCLCEECHQHQHELRQQLDEAIALGGELERLIGYAKGLYLLGAPNLTCTASLADIRGIADAFGIEPVAALGCMRGAVISSDLLFEQQEDVALVMQHGHDFRHGRLREAA